MFPNNKLLIYINWEYREAKYKTNTNDIKGRNGRIIYNNRGF